MDAEQQIDKIRTFLAGELARTEDKACVQIDVVNSDDTAREKNSIAAWQRDQLHAGADWIARAVIEVAQGTAAKIGSGKQGFVVRVQQRCGARLRMSFAIVAQKEEQEHPVDDPYRTSHPPEVKIDGRIADQLLRHLDGLINDDKLDSVTRRSALTECYRTLRAAIEFAQGGTIASLMEAVTKENTKLLEATAKETDKLYDSIEKMTKENDILRETFVAQVTKRERITQMAATIAAGIWARNDFDLDLDDAHSKAIVAKLARETAELILQQETVDVR